MSAALSPSRIELPPEPVDGARVVDAEGDTWRRDGAVWRCEAPVDGERILFAAWLVWGDMVASYGPLRPVGRAS